MIKEKTAFDIIQELSSSREYDYNPDTEKILNEFLTNRGFSNFNETIMLANEMNSMAISKCPKKWLYDFYFYAIKPKKKRFSSWAKPKKDNRVRIISESYKCSKTIAEQYSLILSDDDVDELEQKMSKGGR